MTYMKMHLTYLTSRESDKMHSRLEWYEKVSKDLQPAKYRMARRIACDIDPDEVSDECLWKEHEHLAGTARTLLDEVKSGRRNLADLPVVDPSFLDLKAKLLSRAIRRCTFCEWKCKVDRVAFTKRGACKLDSTSRVNTWFLHFGEEPPLVGHGGSGTIFFSSCNFRCAFCQNWDISQDPTSGAQVDPRQLALIIKSLRSEGALNINFVGGEPTPNLHTIVEAINQIDVNVPMLWNSNMYCSEEAMRILTDLIDIWLPDFKYGNDKCAIRLSKVPRYFEVVSRNHEYAQSNGDMIIRHLVMPNHVECCTKPVLRWVSKHCSRALVNIMGQYHPDNRVLREHSTYSDIARRPTAEEMHEACEFADELGIIYSPVS
jgi:putative pyruvate formate lyase activating enzyme